MFNLVLLVVLIVLALAFVAAPMRSPKGGRRGKTTRIEDLEAQKTRALEVIRDLEFDHQTGKLLEDDYRSSMKQYRTRAIGIMKEMDRLLENQGIEEMVEREIKRIRTELEKVSEA